MPGFGVGGEDVEAPAVGLGLGQGLVEAGGEVGGSVGDDGVDEGAEGAEFGFGEGLGWRGGVGEAGGERGAGLGGGVGAFEEGLEGWAEGLGVRRCCEVEGLGEGEDVLGEFAGALDGAEVAGGFEGDELGRVEVGEGVLRWASGPRAASSVPARISVGMGSVPTRLDQSSRLPASLPSAPTSQAVKAAWDMRRTSFAVRVRMVGSRGSLPVLSSMKDSAWWRSVAASPVLWPREASIWLRLEVFSRLDAGRRGRDEDEAGWGGEGRGVVEDGARDDGGDFAAHGVAGEEPAGGELAGVEGEEGGADFVGHGEDGVVGFVS